MSSASPNNEWLSEDEAASFVGKTIRTLRQWRQKREGPPFAYFGRTVRYHRGALVKFYESNQIINPVRKRRT